jgi:cysteine desulfurase
LNIYLDNNATTRIDPEVIEAMMPYLADNFGNPNSVHEYGQEARFAVDRARTQIAALINADPEEIIFTSGGTESCNTALFGICSGLAAGKKRKALLLYSSLEHPSVANCAENLSALDLAGTARINAEQSGRVDTAHLKKMLEAGDVDLVSLMTVNNDTGVLMPVARAAGLAHDRGALFHTDAVQAVGKTEVDVKKLDVDMLSCSAHKLYGPKGIGALYLKRGTALAALLHGGPQEYRLRAGTENVAAIVGFGAACELAGQDLDKRIGKIRELRNRLEKGLSALEGMEIFGQNAERIAGTVYAGFAGISGETLQMALDMNGFSVSTGSACSSELKEPSHVLLAMGISPEKALSAVRFSIGKDNTEEEIDQLVAVTGRLVEQIRGNRAAVDKI